MFLGSSVAEWRELEFQRRLKEEILAAAPIKYSYSVAIDLGKLRDRTVIAAIETAKSKDYERHALKALHVLNLGVSYTKQIGAILEFLEKPNFSIWGRELLVDASGLGEPVSDMLQDRGVKFSRVSITSSGEPRGEHGRLYVSRSYLMQLIVRYLPKESFRISSDLHHAERLKEELKSLRLEFSKAGNQFVAGGQNDDTVVALALCLLGIERRNRLKTGVTSLFGDVRYER